MGTGRSNAAFQGSGPSILDQERLLIDKVFGIVDKDNSGSIDQGEIKEMFNLFGIETQFLDSAINRIMGNVDKDQDGTISPVEFYKLLSQKFQKGDPKKEIDDVFNRIDKDKDKQISVDELHEVAHQLGENIDKKEIRDMIRTFIQMHEDETSKEKKGGPGATKKAGAYDDKPDKDSDKKSVVSATSEAENKILFINPDVWYHIMTVDL